MKHRNAFWGIFFVLAAVVIIGLQFSPFASIGFWSIAATVLLVGIMLNSIFHLSFAPLPIPLALLYLIYQKPLALPYINIWLLLGAAVLLSIGLSFLVGGIRRGRKRDFFVETRGGHYSGTHIDAGKAGKHLEIDQNTDDNHPYARVKLGAMSKYLHGDCLESGLFESNLGALEVFFDQCTLAPGGADIQLDCSLGAITLFVPKHWRVEDNISAALGGVDHDMRFYAPEANAPVLRLSGNVSLGGIEIKHV